MIENCETADDTIMRRTIEFDDIEREVVRGMAVRIRVQPFWAVNCPYLAELHLVEPQAHSASGHPYVLWASARTPHAAVEKVIAMIYIWLRNPKDKRLIQTRGEFDRGVGVDLSPPRRGI